MIAQFGGGDTCDWHVQQQCSRKKKKKKKYEVRK